MDYPVEKMIADIETKFPLKNQLAIQNISDLNIEAKFKNTYQYIIGVTRADSFGSHVNFDNYKYNIQNLIKDTSLGCQFFGWPFKGEEASDAKETLKSLLQYFNADLDAEKMIEKLNITKKDSDEYYYIVITVIIVPFFSFE
jgi:hypothetical protein